ncbi:CD63 antigen [Brachyhypopomus gauderio]|uniref:CD63 antigen n=1 Tax=Brachyhypopomus gauderio TaxID=698409 RepID=UPI00404204E4
MAVEGGMKCVKFLVFFFNFVFWLCGLALIVLGVVVQVVLYKTPVIKDASGSAAPIVLIVIGAVIFLVSFFGCCGAWKENYCMITMFAIFMSVVIIAEIATAIAAYVFRDKLTKVVGTGLKDMISQYNNNTDIKKSLDDLQHELKCCGAVNYNDWASFRLDKHSVPDSCCIKVTKDCGVNATVTHKNIFTKGCQPALEDLLKSKILWVAVAALVIAFIQILGLVFSCMLMRAIRSGYEVM